MTKRTVKPIVGEYLGDYWRRCGGSFGLQWYNSAAKYAEKNGAVREGNKITAIRG